MERGRFYDERERGRGAPGPGFAYGRGRGNWGPRGGGPPPFFRGRGGYGGYPNGDRGRGFDRDRGNGHDMDGGRFRDERTDADFRRDAQNGRPTNGRDFHERDDRAAMDVDRPGNPPPPGPDGPPPAEPPPPPEDDVPAPPPVKKVPLSLEELINKRNEEKSATEKPKFLTKEERAKLAIEKRQQEVEAEKARQEEERKHRLEFLSKAEETNKRARYDDRNDRYRDQRDYNMRGGWGGRGGRGGSLRGGRDNRDERETAPKVDEDEMNEEKMKEITVQAIRERYMGADRKKRRIRRMNEKKFVFDWDQGEDTSKDPDPIYAKRQDNLLFGRGTIAGVDVREQKEKRGKFWEELVERRMTEGEKERVVELLDMERKTAQTRSYADRHWSEKPLDQMTERDWRILKEDFNISTKGGQIPNPMRTWEESGIPQKILDVVKDIGYTEPSPIQRQTIPIGLQNRDLIGVAETGSGKTASFVIPMLTYIMDLPLITESNAGMGPYALILAPTRELAQQIESEANKFAKRMDYTIVSIVGGHAIEEQSFQLRNGAHIIVATPGRLKDCLEKRILVLSQCTYVIMDEADRMIDLGFEPDVNYILDQLPVSNLKPDTDDAENPSELLKKLGLSGRYRQTFMFSATFPPAVERLAKKYLRRPATVTIGTAGQAVDTVEQRVEMISSEEKKKNRLLEILEEFDPPILVFVNQKRSVDLIARALEKQGYGVATLHGGKTQDLREAALREIKTGVKDVLVATDVAGRGIDIKDVSLVVNYDMAKNIEDYTHRIGRTGRAGKSGIAITFLNPTGDAAVMYDLKMTIQKSPISKVPPELAKHENAQTKPSASGAMVKKRQDEVLYL